MTRSIIAMLLAAISLPAFAQNPKSANRTDTTVTISATGAPALIMKADAERAGVMSAADKKKLDRIELLSSYSELRSVSNINATTTYRLLYNKTIGDFIYDPSDNASADDTAMTIVTASGKRLKRYVENWIDVRWFGANPASDGADDWPYIQKAIDWVIKYRTHGTVYLPAGDYVLSRGLLIRKDENKDGHSEFVSVDLLGSKTASTDGSENGGETVLRCHDPNDFGIAVQKGKTMSIKNIAFSGKNLAGYNVSQYNVGNSGTSFLAAGIRNNRYSPYAAIVIDPFGPKAVLPDNRYPRRADLYTEPNNAGSSAISVENCFIRGFAVGICNSPNGITQNAEGHNFEHLWIDMCKSAIVNCNSQARTVYCRDIKVWGGVECVFDHQRYGDGTSSAMLIEDVNIAGCVKYIIATTNWGIGYFHQLNKVHVESTWAIGGDIVNGANLGNIVFKNSQIDLMGESPGQQQRAPIIAWCNSLELQDSYIGYYSANDGSMMFCNAAMVIMRNTTGSMIHTQGNYETSVYTELSVNSGDRPYYFTTDGSGVSNDIQLRPGLEVFKNGYMNFANNGLQMKQKYCGKAMNLYSLNGTFAPASVDANARKAVFKVGDEIFKCAPGAYVTTVAKDDFGKNVLMCAGIVTAVNVGEKSITVGLLSNRITAGASISLIMTAPAKLHNNTAFYLGDITRGATTISNIVGDYSTGNYMRAGCYFNHPAFKPGTYITAVTANSITLSTAALYTETGAFVLNETNWENTGLAGETQATFSSFYNQTVFKEGDIIRAGYSNNSGVVDGNKLAYVCVKAGLFGTNRLPQFKVIYANPQITTDSAGTAPHALYFAADGTIKKGAIAGGAAAGIRVADLTGDANQMVPANVSMVELHDGLSANRTFTLPAATRQGQTLSVVLRHSTSAKKFNLATPVFDNTTGATFTQLDWGKTYDFYVNSNNQWMLIRKY